MLKRNVCAYVIRLSLNVCLNQKLVVRWNGEFSQPFTVSNGVKQGGIISPTLFCIYIDELLNELKKSGSGCYIGFNFYVALGYADDIILLNPSICGMQKMLNICNKYAVSHKMQFNVKKSQVMFFPCKKNKYP